MWGLGPVQFALHLHLEGKFGGANKPFAGLACPEGCLDFELFFRATFGIGATGGYGHPLVVPLVAPEGQPLVAADTEVAPMSLGVGAILIVFNFASNFSQVSCVDERIKHFKRP